MARLVENPKKAVMFQSENRTAEAFYWLSLFVSDTPMIYWILKLLQLVSVCYTYRSTGGSDKQILSDLEQTETIVVVLPDSYWFWGPQSWSCSSLRQTLGKSSDWEKTFWLHHGRCSWIWACCWCCHAIWAAGIADAGKRYYRRGECVWTLCFFLCCCFCVCVCVCVRVCVLVLFCFLNEHLWCNVCCTVFVCEYPGCIIVCWELEKAGWVGTHTHTHAHTHTHTHMHTGTHASVCNTVCVTCFNLITYRNVRLVQIHINHRFSEFPQGMWKELCMFACLSDFYAICMPIICIKNLESSLSAVMVWQLGQGGTRWNGPLSHWPAGIYLI